jgi:hypothetical protein
MITYTKLEKPFGYTIAGIVLFGFHLFIYARPSISSFLLL